MRSLKLSHFRLPIIGLALLAVAGCAAPKKGDITGAVPDDVRSRHPIYVTRGKAVMDILPGGGPGGLTDRQVADIQGFAMDWQRRGRGALVMQVPGGLAAQKEVSYGVREIRRVLGSAGVTGKRLSVVNYPADGPSHLAPVRLEYSVLEAKLPHECGQWPDDIGYSDPESSSRNEQYWNFGCASQQNLAAQVEDPEDFIRPRAEAPASATRRTDVMRRFGRGEPTATSYPSQTLTVGGQ